MYFLAPNQPYGCLNSKKTSSYKVFKLKTPFNQISKHLRVIRPSATKWRSYYFGDRDVDIVEPRYSCRHKTGLIRHRSVPKKVRVGIFTTPEFGHKSGNLKVVTGYYKVSFTCCCFEVLYR